MSSRKPAITREECELKERNNADKLEEIHDEVKAMRVELKTALEWQAQFKGGLKVIGFLIGGAGTIGAIIAAAAKIFKHS